MLTTLQSEFPAGQIQPTVGTFCDHTVPLVLLQLLCKDVGEGQPSEGLVSGHGASAKVLAAFEELLVNLNAVQPSFGFGEAVSLAADQHIGLRQGAFELFKLPLEVGVLLLQDRYAFALQLFVLSQFGSYLLCEVPFEVDSDGWRWLRFGCLPFGGLLDLTLFGSQ